jgi:ribosomal protein S15P/S13E
MRSKTAKRILEETPQEVKDKVQDYANKLILYNVSQQRELLIAYEKNHYTPQEWALASKQCIEDIDNFLAINCG